jgi:DNA polymerase I-like protein with 3'-5' exonuclease and polymerase domains
MTSQQDLLLYNALDAACTLECHNAFWKDLQQDGFEKTYRLTVDLFPAIIYMQTRGIRVDKDALETTKTEILSAAAERQEELNRLCGRPLNVNSPRDCAKYFYVELGLPPFYNDKGEVTVDDMALQRLAKGTKRRPGLRQAKLVQEIRSLRKLYGTYLNIEFDPDGRMRCAYNPRGTRFGRLSSSRTIFGTGTNTQNLPPEFKRFLVADEGKVLWEVDKRQAEWVVVAYLTGDSNMIKVVESGLDAHLYTASLMFNAPMELLAEEAKLIGNSTDPEYIRTQREEHPRLAEIASRLPRTMSARQCGKRSNHGLNYDEGYVKFAMINEMDQTEAKRIWSLYHTTYPGLRLWYESVKRQLQKDRTLTNCFGRKVRFLDAWGPDLWKSAYAMLPQSTVVDSLNIGMAKIYADSWLTKDNDLEILAQVHDSLLLQIPRSVYESPRFKEVKDRVFEYVSPTIEYNSRQFKIATDMKVGLNWGIWHPERNPEGMREVKGD